MRPHQPTLWTPRAVDLFAGGGGASHGIEMATGRSPLVAVNHDPAAIQMHAQNHPGCLHLCESVWDVEPFRPHGRPLDLLWASPDCKHFSRAKGGRPKSKEIRALAWVVTRWAEAVRPRVVCVENVPEFVTWGPLDDAGRPLEGRKGETFRAWVGKLEALGYHVEWRVLVAADYGAPTTRKRLFVVARCDGQDIVWPEPTHGPGREHPYRTAAECIDWSIPAPSIFGRRRPLAEKTQARIAEGIRRFVLEADEPYLAFVANTRNGERKGQRPRVRDLRRPLNTITAQGSQGALVTAFLAKHYTGVVGQGLARPLGTITARDHHSLVAAHLTKFYGTSTGSGLHAPTPTVTATGQHLGMVAAELTPAAEANGRTVAAWLMKYYGQGVGQAVDEPLHTIPTRDRFGLVTVDLDGETYALTDIGMRMLQPRELATAQGFDADYILTGTKTQQVARIGNSVPPQVVAAIVGAQFRTPPRAVRVAA